ncbi:putative penicillin-binding protein PbpX [Phycisphaerae bacterium RAS1]|nr:putative penicillin-binding protein PbpX [Phycisphaerae bacterium RAS1]
MIRRTTLPLALLFAGAICHPAFAGERTAEAAGGRPVPAELEGLRERWLGCMDEFCVPGFAVAVVRNDEIIYLDTFGYRDLEKKLPVTPESAFYIASSTKPFTAMGLLTLVDAGKLALEDPVKKHLPRFELPDAELTAKITVRDLLCHRHGINAEPIVFLDAYTGEITEDRYYHFLKTAEVAGKTSYSNVHFTLAGRVIEAVSGKPWRDYLAQVVFAPAAMKSATGYADEMYRRSDVALPYEVAGEGMRPASVRKSDATMHAAGGLGISVSDLARWLRLNMAGGQIDGKRILKAESAAEMLKPQAEMEPDGRIRRMTGFGLGWGLGTYRDRPYVQHGGGYVGAGAHVSFLPEQRIGIAVVTNAGAPAAMFIDQVVSIDVYDRLLGEKQKDLLPGLREQVQKRLPEMRQRAAAPEADLTSAGALTHKPEAYAGKYENTDFGTLHAAMRDGRLQLRIGDMPLPIVSAKEDVLTLDLGGNQRRCKFEFDADGRACATIEMEVGPVKFVRK